MRTHRPQGLAAFAAAGLVALLGLSASADTPPRPSRVQLQLLGANDLHGHLQPPEPGLGGAAWLASQLDRAAASHPGRTIRVHAGDMVGASPLLSGRFRDEPTIEAMNRMEFDVGTLGNHEFDEGAGEALRLVRRARFPYTSANALREGRLVLPPYRVVRRGGVKVGFIGVTTESAPTYLLARHSAELRFGDISDTVNRYVPELQRRGVEAIVVLAHAGAAPGPEGPGNARGEIVDEARDMSDAVDVVVSGHTHSGLNLRVPGRGGGDKLVVQAFSYGTAFDRVRLTIDRRSGEVVAKSAQIPRTGHDGVAPDGEVESLVGSYAERVRPLGGRVLGNTPVEVPKEKLGETVADAQRAAARADLAVVNPGNLRTGLDAGEITYADLFGVHAYEHRVMRLRMRGSDVRDLLRRPGLHTSGLRGPIDPGRVYTVAANELIATSKDFEVMRDRALSMTPVGTDLEALVRYVERRKGPVTS